MFTEFLRRIESEVEDDEESLSVVHLSTMFWTLGCVRNNLGRTDDDLFSQLRSRLLSESLESLNEKLLVRILWTLLVHEDDSDACRGLVHEVVSLLNSSETPTLRLAPTTSAPCCWLAPIFFDRGIRLGLRWHACSAP